MPTYVRTDKCNGCQTEDQIACVYICPHDLMKLDQKGTHTGHALKAYNQEPEQCWECYACVKACPQQAIEVRHYADVVPLGAMVQPRRGADSITWTIKFRNGTMKRFKFPTRTTVEGSINPALGMIADHTQLANPANLSTNNTHSTDFSQFIAS